jgi:geranylgeranyl reductase family protein
MADKRLGKEYDCEVAVIGAGPTGSVTANQIAIADHHVMLIEKDRFAGETNVCGGASPAQLQEEFAIPSHVVDNNIKRWIYYFPDKILAHDINFISFRRSVFDKYLADRAVANGVELLSETLALDVQPYKDGVTLKLRDGRNGSVYDLKAKMIVFADGPNTLASRFGIGFERDPNRTGLGILYEMEYSNNRLDTLEIFFDKKISPWGYGWIIPKKDSLNVGVGSMISALIKDNHRTNSRQRLNNFVYRYPAVSEKLGGRKVLSFRAATIPGYPARRMYRPRMLVAGDAAGMVEPIWGGGIEFGMRNGMLAAKWAIRAIADDRFEESFLMNYQRDLRSSKDYKWIEKFYRISRLFRFYSKLDQNSLFRMYSLLLRKAHKASDEDVRWSKIETANSFDPGSSDS